MNQQNINQPDEFQPVTEETFFDEETVQSIPAVMPLDETPTRTSARLRKFRVPMRKADKSFNPAFLLMALLAVTALGVIAGTLLYRTAAEKSASNSAEDEPVNRTIPAQYQFVIEKPSSLPKDNLTSTTAPLKKNPTNKSESSEPNAENEPENVPQEKTVEPKETEVVSEEDEEPPPPALPRERKEDKKQNKDKGKNQNAKPETKDDGENPGEESSIGN